MSDKWLNPLYRQLGYTFEDAALLVQALRHPSYTHENQEAGDHNQRLEFLGDAVVGLVVAEALFKSYPEAREGQLTRWRAALVSAKPLAKAAQEIGLADQIILGKGENRGGGRNRASLLSDAFEAVLGATFIDGGLEAARTVVEKVLGEKIKKVCVEAPVDYKSKLQECIQAMGQPTPEYEVINVTGPDHNRCFEVQLKLEDTILGIGKGPSKKSAEQAAAHQSLEKLGETS